MPPGARINSLELGIAPNGRTFREWILIPNPDEARWSALLEEARQFAIASKQ